MEKERRERGGGGERDGEIARERQREGGKEGERGGGREKE